MKPSSWAQEWKWTFDDFKKYTVPRLQIRKIIKIQAVWRGALVEENDGLKFYSFMKVRCELLMEWLIITLRTYFYQTFFWKFYQRIVFMKTLNFIVLRTEFSLKLELQCWILLCDSFWRKSLKEPLMILLTLTYENDLKTKTSMNEIL